MDNNEKGKLADGIKNSVMVKLILIVIIAFALLIPTSSIQNLIYERQVNRDNVVREVSEKWGEAQTLAGPVLNVPYKVYYKNKHEELRYSVHYAHFLPKTLHVSGEVNPTVRSRSIYDVVLYNTKLNFSGEFEKPDFGVWDIDSSKVSWEEAYVTIGIPDMSGIQQDLKMNWNGKEVGLESGLPDKEVLRSGLFCRVPVKDEGSYKFNFDIDLNGSSQLSFIPLGKKTRVDLSSTWKDPSFNGKFLPDSHDISEKGFKATWEVLDVNRNYPQQWKGDAQDIDNASFGVSLILPVHEYQKNVRSAKYALLVISLTFIIFFIIGIINKRRFHPFQYIMVGSAIVLFYCLLISFTEHIGFNMAYLISALLVVSLIVVYVSAVFKSVKLTALLASLLIVIYFFIFVILQLEDFALLVGSLGLFAALAALMYTSRNINWYDLQGKYALEKSNE